MLVLDYLISEEEDMKTRPSFQGCGRSTGSTCNERYTNDPGVKLFELVTNVYILFSAPYRVYFGITSPEESGKYIA